jgi:MtfA peptidase
MSDYLLAVIFFSLPLCIFIFIRVLKLVILYRRKKLADQRVLSHSAKDFLTENFYPYRYLSPQEKARLDWKIRYFLANKSIVGIGDLQITEDMRLLIAAQACLLLVNLNLEEIYPGLKNIFVAPTGYIEIDNPVDPALGIPVHVPRLGETWKRGPIILSWEAILRNAQYPKQRQNLIYHEFSHHLDQQDGHFDGTPELSSPKQYQIWASVMSKEFVKLRNLVADQRKSDIDSYGATNEAEFFAVCTEYFFSDPQRLYRKHPGIFEVLKNYFKIDPLKWG